LTFTLSMVLDSLVVLGEIILPLKGALIRALVRLCFNTSYTPVGCLN
jgi:hypothetical protein